MDFCRFYRARLSQFQSGQLSASEREKVAAHLATCADCARARDELESESRLARAALGELAPLRAPADLRFKVRAALQNGADARAKPLFGFDFRRPNTARLVWAGTLSFSAVALMILARPFSTAPLSPAPLSPAPLSPAPLSPAPLSTAPLSTAPVFDSAPLPRPQKAAAKAPKIVAVRPTSPATTTSSPRRESPRIAANSGIAPLPAPPSVRISPQPKAAPTRTAPREVLKTPSFPSLSGKRSPSMPPRQTVARAVSPPALAARPKIAAPPDAEMRLRATSETAKQAGRNSAAMEAAPRFAIALSAQEDSTAKSGMRDASEPTVNGAGAAPDVSAGNGPSAPSLASPATGAASDGAAPRRDDEDLSRARGESLTESFSTRRVAPSMHRAPATAVPEDAPRFGFAAPSARAFRLSVTAPRAYSQAQIRVVLPPPLRFASDDASASRVVWRGDFAANVAVNVEFGVQGARGNETISLFVEQNQGEGKSKVLETQTVALPPSIARH